MQLNILALVLNALAPLAATATPLASRQGSQPDCAVAKALNQQLEPLVDCSYSGGHLDNSVFLLYFIRISPTGQNSHGWAKGIRDNLKADCRGKLYNWYLGKEFHNVSEEYCPQEINSFTYYGLDMTMPLAEADPDEEAKTCVANAIKKASCNVDLTFINGTCYRTPGEPIKISPPA